VGVAEVEGGAWGAVKAIAWLHISMSVPDYRELGERPTYDSWLRLGELDVEVFGLTCLIVLDVPIMTGLTVLIPSTNRGSVYYLSLLTRI